jgi:hypothetical protein
VSVVLVLAGIVVEPSAAKWSRPFTVVHECDCTDVGPLVVGGADAAVVTWVAYRREVLKVRRVARGGRLGRARTLGSVAFGGDYALARTGSGSVIAVWQHADLGIRARRITPRGRLGRIHRIFGSSGAPHDLDVALDARGRATIAWSGVVMDGRDSPPILPRDMHVRRLTRSGQLGPLVVLRSESESGLDLHPQVAVTAAGDALVAWEHRPAGPGPRIRVATIDRNGVAGPLRTVTESLSYGSAPRLGIDSRGNGLIAWYSEAPPGVMARRMSPDGALGPIYSPAPGEQISDDPRLGLDRAGNATVAWSSGSVKAWRLDGDTPSPVLDLSRLPDATKADCCLEMAVDSAGYATGAWVRTPHAFDSEWKPAVLARRVAPDGSIGALHTLSPPGSLAFPQIVSSARGIVTASWTSGPPDSKRIVAARYVPRGGSTRATAPR